MTNEKTRLYQALNVLLGQCGELRQEFRNASVDQIPDVWENYVGTLMAVRTMTDSLLELDPERQVELQAVRDKYHSEILRLTGDSKDTTGFWRSHLGLGAAVGSI